jgi:hypothetical protein
VPLRVAEVALVDGVKSVPEDAELVVLWRATQLEMGSVFPPLLKLAGSVNVRLTFALAWPEIENVAALDDVTATEADSPGKTFPNARSFVLVTVMGCCTSAVTLALAEFCAYNAGAKSSAAQAARAVRNLSISMVQ